MKLLTVLSTTVYSSHYRGGTYIFTSNADGTTSIQQTQTWRDGSAGIAGICTKAHEGTLTSSTVATNCNLITEDGSLSGGRCPNFSLNWPYIVGFSSNGEMGASNDYCYGSYTQQMTTPSAGYRIGWSACCWVDLTDDDGQVMSNAGDMELHATVFDPTNNSPVFTHPPLWRVMSGCDGQSIDLSPKDPDGDTVKCRWAETFEEGGASTYNAVAWPSLSLDGDNCVVTYTGSIDDTKVGLKGVGIMMEDFDTNGKVKSSIPVQFLTAVWTPQSTARGASVLGGSPYPDWFSEKDGEAHHDVDHHKSSSENKGKKRGRRTTTPAYCSAIPILTEPTPEDGSLIEEGESFEITLTAESEGGSIKSFSYEKPARMACSNPDQNGSVTCTWTPTDSERENTDHGFCFLATDSLGLTSERRCITLRVPEEPACEEGFEESDDGCIDTDECTANTHICHTNANCVNTPGSYNCVCFDGYRGDGILECAEIDECQEETHLCHLHATCSNTPGSYDCTCNDGWQGNGFNCFDIDEEPACDEGFEESDDGCIDTDECTANTHICHTNANCVNTPGSYNCVCFDGYRGDGILECAEIDECQEETHLCHLHATCSNTPGSYDCTCNDGWQGNGFNCFDIDECATNTHDCHELAYCTNTPGSYDCTCNDGYMGDGFLCSVPCATFYDTAHDGFMTNTSAFSTGTFEVSNLDTFETSPSQTNDNWKPSTGFNNKASFITVQPKCTLEAFSGMNFQGKKLGQWNGKLFYRSQILTSNSRYMNDFYIFKVASIPKICFN